MKTAEEIEREENWCRMFMSFFGTPDNRPKRFNKLEALLADKNEGDFFDPEIQAKWITYLSKRRQSWISHQFKKNFLG